MVTKNQITECLGILIRRVQTINDRTKKHTKEHMEERRLIKELQKRLDKIENQKH